MLNVVIFLLSLSSFCTPFSISELFSSRNHEGHDKALAWIELVNLTNDPILVSHMHLIITESDRDAVVFDKEITFPIPIKWLNYLLVAQNDRLGQKRCLRENIAVAVMTGLHIPRQGIRKLCITINKKQKNCVTITQKMLDGISLYRELKDKSERPLWRHEPCHLIDNIFASPGLPPRTCGVPAEHIFKRCDNITELHITKNSLGNLKKFEATMPAIDVIPKTNNSFSVLLKHDNAQEFSLISLCARPRQSQKICHIIEDEQVIADGVSKEFTTSNWHQSMGERFFLNVNDLSQPAFAVELAAISHDSSHTPWQPAVIDHHKNDRTVTLALSHDDVPINVAVIADSNEIMWQKAFVTPGEKIITLTRANSRSTLTLTLDGVRGRHTRRLASDF